MKIETEVHGEATQRQTGSQVQTHCSQGDGEYNGKSVCQARHYSFVHVHFYGRVNKFSKLAQNSHQHYFQEPSPIAYTNKIKLNH